MVISRDADAIVEEGDIQLNNSSSTKWAFTKSNKLVLKAKVSVVAEEEGEDSSNNPSLPVPRISVSHNSVKSSLTVNSNSQCMASNNSSVNTATNNLLCSQLLKSLRPQ